MYERAGSHMSVPLFEGLNARLAVSVPLSHFLCLLL